MKRLFCLLLMLSSPVVFADLLADRLAGFATEHESRASFVETWMAEYLDKPLISKGRLHYKVPGQLSKFIEQPEVVTQRVIGDQLLLERNGETHTSQLSQQPELAAGIYALRDVLEGNINGLLGRFEVNFTEIKTVWMLTLVPKEKKIANRIARIVLHGNGNRISDVRIEYHNGDSLLTEIIHDR